MHIFYMDSQRLDALLTGRVPLPASSPGLGSAYLSATRTLLGSSACGKAIEPLSHTEVCTSLLAGPEPLKRLSLQMLGAMLAGGAEGEAALLQVGAVPGAMPQLIDSLHALVCSVLALVEAGTPPPAELLSDLECGSSALCHFMDPGVYKACPSIALGGYAALGRLLARAAHLARRSCEAAQRAAQASSTGSGMYAQIEVPAEVRSCGQVFRAAARAYLDSTGHPTEECLVVLDAALAEEGVVAAVFAVLALIPRTPHARKFALLLGNATEALTPDLALASQAMASVGSLIEAIASTSHSLDTQEMLITTLSNLLRLFPTTCPPACIESGALHFLQPALMGEPSQTVLQTAAALSAICRSDLAGEPDRSAVLRLLSSVLRAITPGSIPAGGFELSPVILSDASLLSDPSAHPAMQLALLQLLCMACTGPPEDTEHNVGVCLRTEAVKAGLRVCVAHRDAFVYATAGYLLRQLGLAVPFFLGDTGKGSAAGGGEEEAALGGGSASSAAATAAAAASWSIEQVCTWVGKRPFRAYRGAFRDSLVNGRMLLELSDEDLLAVGVEHPLHRRAILQALGDLVAAGSGSGSGSGSRVGGGEGGAGAAAGQQHAFSSALGSPRALAGGSSGGGGGGGGQQQQWRGCVYLLQAPGRQ
jgi:hypothetical protein